MRDSHVCFGTCCRSCSARTWREASKRPEAANTPARAAHSTAYVIPRCKRVRLIEVIGEPKPRSKAAFGKACDQIPH